MNALLTGSAYSLAAKALAWLLTYTLHSTVLLAAAWAAAHRLGRRSLALQETLWRCALLGGIVTASVQLGVAQLGGAPLVGGWQLAVLQGSSPLEPAAGLRLPATAVKMAGATAAPLPAGPAAPGATDAVRATRAVASPAVVGTSALGSGDAANTASAAAAMTSAASPAGSSETLARSAGSVARSARLAAGSARPAAISAGWQAMPVLAAWLGGALLLSGAYLRSYVGLRRRLRYRPRVVGGAVLPRLAGLARQTSGGRPVRLTTTWRLRVPVALGGRQPEVCVPPRALFQLTDEQQDALLAHEVAHIRRHDPAWLLVHQMLVAVLFFQPLNWVARRKLRELSELACDRWAVAQTGRPLSLAGCLAEVAGWSLGGPRRTAALLLPGMADRPSQLAFRIRRLLEGNVLEGGAPLHRGVFAAALGGLAVAALVMPGVSTSAAASVPARDSAPVVAGRPAAPTPTPTSTPAASTVAGGGADPAPVRVAMAPLAAPQASETAGEAAMAPAAPAAPADAVEAAAPPGSSDPDRLMAHSADSAGPADSAEMAEPADLADMDSMETSHDHFKSMRFEDLDQFNRLTGEQLEAIDKSFEQISAQVNQRLQQQLRDLDRQIAAAHEGLSPMPELHRKELAGLDHDLAMLGEHLVIDPQAMARLDANIKKLVAEAPRLAARDIARFEKEFRAEMKRYPLALSKEDIERLTRDAMQARKVAGAEPLTAEQIERLKKDAARAIESSRAALESALAETGRARSRFDEEHSEDLRRLERQRQDLTRAIEKQRAELEAMRRDIEREADAYRDLARRESEAHRLRPKTAAPKAAPAAPVAPVAQAAPVVKAAPVAPAAPAAPATHEPAPAPTPNPAAPPPF